MRDEGSDYGSWRVRLSDYVPHRPKIGKHLKFGDRLDHLDTGVLVWCPLCGYEGNVILTKTIVWDTHNNNRRSHNIHRFACKRCNHKIKFEIDGV